MIVYTQRDDDIGVSGYILYMFLYRYCLTKYVMVSLQNQAPKSDEDQMNRPAWVDFMGKPIRPEPDLIRLGS